MFNKHHGSNNTSYRHFSFYTLCSSGNILFVTAICAVHITQHYKHRTENFSLKRLLSKSLPLGMRTLQCINPHLKLSTKVRYSKTMQAYHNKEMLTETECQTTTLET